MCVYILKASRDILTQEYILQYLNEVSLIILITSNTDQFLKAKIF